ncbi:MAG: hypothetical protein H8E59_03430 [Actinobacteria bacterium]|nr:hypothetical protein [Actinomycetota bacterium]
MNGWECDRPLGGVAERHLRDPCFATRRVLIHEVDRPTLVLGSAQRDGRWAPDEARLQAAGCDLVRRRSGGGGVLLRPGHVLWVDVILPRGDDLWDDDVGCSGLWLGDVWAAVLEGMGLVAEVHRGALVGGRWSGAVCFAGRGPGEVSVGGRKVVGISQRRTREGAWFQCAALLEWRPREMVDLLGLEPVGQVMAELEACAVGLVDLLAGDSPGAEGLSAALSAALLAEFSRSS